MKAFRWTSAALVLAVVNLGIVTAAQAQRSLWEGEKTSLELGANLQMLSAYVTLPELGMEGVPEAAGLGSAVGRLEWRADIGEHISLEVHNRFLWQSSTLPVALWQQGFGVTRSADRRVDTRSAFIDGETTTLVHDLDRAVVGLYFDYFDLYLGRQAISWGMADLFSVADRFAPLSPFELDTLQRRGLDAARAITHVTSDLELEILVADRGEEAPLTVAGRGQYFGADMDIYAGFGRFWQRLSAMGGISWLVGYWKFYGEGELLWNLEERGLDRPRATLGAQRVSTRWQAGLEYHYNGLGVVGDDGYTEVLQREEFQRGESYFMGRHYAGGTGYYLTDGGWSFGGGAMMNLLDPSAVIFPTIRFDLQEQMTVSAGAYLGLGEEATLAVGDDGVVGPELASEYGGFSDLYFLQIAAFF